MRKLNLLFITKDRSQQVERSSFYLADELSGRTNLVMWGADGHIQNILASLPFTPDFILINDYRSEYMPKVRGLHAVSIPKGMIMHDLHYKKYQRKRFIEKENIQLVFTHYRDAFLQYFPELSPRMVWFPHFIHPGVFKDYHQPKAINYLMMGASFPHLYPVRNSFMHQLKKEPGFVCHAHPGYRAIGRSEKGAVAGTAYAMELNRSKIFLTCDSIYHYPVMKYFEALAANALLIAPASKELADLGFIDGHTFVAADSSNVLHKARTYLANEQQRLQIAHRGMNMVRSRHTTTQRVTELLQKIKEVTGK
ncbi:glycosyltransferase [Fictibacillus iocasae]|uniref:Glycosyltransferase n=1 Tax=Fictibacillus iocasae TaxID=2715437 RepID=A0ABW2NMH1_9BACL